jgi:glycosyltransferase involved in cell wall biosynthesis
MSFLQKFASLLMIGSCIIYPHASSLFSDWPSKPTSTQQSIIPKVARQEHASSSSVLFLVPKLNLGGTEKAFIEMLNFLPPPMSRYDVCVLEPGGVLTDSLPYGPQYISLKQAKKRHYAAAVSYAQWIPPSLWVKKIKAKKRIQWCHVDLATIGLRFPLQEPKGRKGIDVFVAVSKAAADSIVALDKNLRHKTLTIHNCVNEETIRKKAKEPQNQIIPHGNMLNLVTVGRLAHEKGIDRAIQVHRKLHEDGFRFHWYFIGDGALKEELQEMARNAGLENYIHFLGLKKNPYPYIQDSDIFVLCSRSESWGLVVSEAMILHKPIVSTKLDGVCEQIRSGENGLIVPNNEEGLYAGIKSLIQNTTMRNQFSKALESFHYDNNSITEQLDTLFFEKQAS